LDIHMLRLLLIRHGETPWNAAARFQGQSDVPLNHRGRHQAATLARVMAGEAIQALYASDLRRAWQTAQAIAAITGLTAQPEPRLREMSFGVWEGLTYGDIERRDHGALTAWQAAPSEVAPPQGETLTQVADRVRQAYDDMVGKHMGHTVALVAHGGPLQVLLCLALGLPPRSYWQLRIDLGSISELRIYAQGAILTRLNDTHHLDEASDDG
jgi:alpha-ribazole phosphatase